MRLFVCLTVIVYAFAVFAEDFDPGACPDLAVKIYPGNGSWRVLHATGSSYSNRSLGYDFVGVLTTGKPSKKRMRTYLRMDMGQGKSSRLDFLMTIPDTEEHHYSLVTEYHWEKQPRSIPLKTVKTDKGTIVFRSLFSRVTIDVKSNTAKDSLAPGKQFPVEWLKDGFKIKGLPGELGDFQFVMPFSNYRGCNGGVTAVRRKIGKRYLLLPVYEILYLESEK